VPVGPVEQDVEERLFDSINVRAHVRFPCESFRFLAVAVDGAVAVHEPRRHFVARCNRTGQRTETARASFQAVRALQKSHAPASRFSWHSVRVLNGLS
jgi:hypothetical protein